MQGAHPPQTNTVTHPDDDPLYHFHYLPPHMTARKRPRCRCTIYAELPKNALNITDNQAPDQTLPGPVDNPHEAPPPQVQFILSPNPELLPQPKEWQFPPPSPASGDGISPAQDSIGHDLERVNATQGQGQSENSPVKISSKDRVARWKERVREYLRKRKKKFKKLFSRAGG